MKFIIDPTNSFNIGEGTINDILGILPLWVSEIPEDEDLKNGLEEAYGMGSLYSMTGGLVEEEGTYIYPSDPELKPLVRCDRVNETYYQYHYGIISIVYKDGRDTFVTRMD